MAAGVGGHRRGVERFERRYGIEFEGIRDGAPKSERERLIQFKTNIDIALSVMEEKAGLGEWISDRLVSIGDGLDRDLPLSMEIAQDPFLDERLTPAGLPVESPTVEVADPHSGTTATSTIDLFMPAGQKKGARRAISEVGRWLNYVTGNRFLTMAADLSGSINVDDVEHDVIITDDGSGGLYGYRMSKAAANMAALNLSHERKASGIAVMALHPGSVRTQMTAGLSDQATVGTLVEPKQAAAGLIARLDELNLGNTGTFRHANGASLPW